jgi:hypothetical protein
MCRGLLQQMQAVVHDAVLNVHHVQRVAAANAGRSS